MGVFYKTTVKLRKALNPDKIQFLMIKFILIWLFALIMFSGCFNERGVSMRYYNDCEEFYDSQGYYHKKCDDNLLNYSDVKKAFTPSNSEVSSKVW